MKGQVVIKMIDLKKAVICIMSVIAFKKKKQIEWGPVKQEVIQS